VTTRDGHAGFCSSTHTHKQAAAGYPTAAAATTTPPPHLQHARVDVVSHAVAAADLCGRHQDAAGADERVQHDAALVHLRQVRHHERQLRVEGCGPQVSAFLECQDGGQVVGRRERDAAEEDTPQRRAAAGAHGDGGGGRACRRCLN